MRNSTGNRDCVFCSIIRGEAESATVFEDDSTLAFLDIRQPNEGKVLVVPKRHFEQIYDLDDEIASALARTVRRVARAVRRVYEPEGLSIWQSNGPAAGQEIPHVHWHVLPRCTNDRLLVVYPAGVAGRARSRSMQFLRSISGQLIEALKDEAL